MDLWEVLKVVIRRWQVSGPLLVATILAAIFVPPTIAPTYTATGITVLIAPMDPVAGAQNPYAILGATTTAQAIAISSDTQPMRVRVAEGGGTTDYSVTQQSTRQPILVVEGNGPTPAIAQRTVELALGVVEQQLSDRQAEAGAPPRSRISTQLLTPQVIATPVYQAARRARLLLLGFGFILAIGLVLLLEGIAVLRRKGSEEPSTDGEPQGRRAHGRRAVSEGSPTAERNARSLLTSTKRPTVTAQMRASVRSHQEAASSE